jgi:NADH:ubiquinone oxidoreductase subunit K
MLPIATFHYLAVAAALFVLGVVGVLTRRSVLVSLLSIELILNAANLNLLAFSHMWGNLYGQVFAIFVTVIAAAQVIVGLGIAIAFLRSPNTSLRTSIGTSPDQT